VTLSAGAAPPRISGASPDEVLRRLELAVGRRLDGMLQGDHLGLVPGQGSEIGEARPYVPGDDVRRIDWNITARIQTPHIRETIADRELEAWMMVDLSASLRFGTANCTKLDLAIAGMAAVGFLTGRHGNRVGALLLDGHQNRVIPARQGRAHVQSILRGAIAGGQADGAGMTDLALGLRRLGGVVRRRGMIVVISDFLTTPGWVEPLRGMATRHEVLAIEVVDPRELELPRVGMLRLVDPETGALRDVQTNNRGVRERYARAAREQRAATAATLRGSGVDHLVLRTDGDWLIDIVRFVALRRDRLAQRQRAGR
jgi:prepilin-type processing-associated H-X9-DG protein